MAEMYKELHGEGEYQYLPSENGTRGTRTFQRNDAAGDVAVASLPVILSSLMVDLDGNDVTGCLCRSARAVFIGGDGGTPGIAYEYSTEESGYSSSGNQVPKDDGAEDFEIGAQRETFTPDPDVPDGDYWHWGASVQVEQELSRVVPHGQFSFPFPQTITSAKRNALVARLNTYIGAINAASFKGYAEGQVMFVGATGGSYRTASWELVYRVMLRFEARILRTDLKGNTISADDWLYVLSDANGQYKKPRTNTSTKYLYEKKDFSTGGLLAAVS